MSKPTALPRQALFTAAESAAFRYGYDCGWARRGDVDWAALGVKGRPRPQVRATRDAEPPYDVHLELVDEDDET